MSDFPKKLVLAYCRGCGRKPGEWHDKDCSGNYKEPIGGRVDSRHCERVEYVKTIARRDACRRVAAVLVRLNSKADDPIADRSPGAMRMLADDLRGALDLLGYGSGS